MFPKRLFWFRSPTKAERPKPAVSGAMDGAADVSEGISRCPSVWKKAAFKYTGKKDVIQRKANNNHHFLSGTRRQ